MLRNSQESKISTSSRNAFVILVKSENGWWNRLLKGEEKTPRNVKVDWDKWVDEDEEDEAKNNSKFLSDHLDSPTKLCMVLFSLPMIPAMHCLTDYVFFGSSGQL